MKKISLYMIFFCLLGITSCQDAFLDLDPLDAKTDVVYFKKPEHFREYASGFYSQLLGWRSGIFDHMDFSSDLVFNRNANQWDMGHGKIAVGYDDGRWDGLYGSIRVNNILLEKAKAYSGDQADIKQYTGEAHFFRAYNYFYLLKYFGGVPLITEVLDVNSPGLKAPRNSRYEVVDLILSDLHQAIAGLPSEQNIPATDKGRISKQGAQAFKARVLLYEATWRKYVGTTTDFEGSAGPASDQVNAFLEESIALSSEVMNDNAFELWDFNSNPDMKNLSSRYLFCIEDAESNPIGKGRESNKEFILYSVFDRVANPGAIELNQNMWYVYPTRKLVDMFLCTDGLPVEKSSSFKGYHTPGDEFDNRDYRLEAYIGRPTADMNLSGNSGYGNWKFQTYKAAENRQESANYPVLRLAEVYLNYAEAVMERYGAIEDAQLENSINKLRKRAGIAPLTNHLVTANGLDMLTEIRRERTLELYMEGFRYDDLKRWGKAEEELNQSRCGMVVGDRGYRTTFKDADGNPTDKYDIKSYTQGEEKVETGDGNLSCIVVSQKADCSVSRQHYLWPIPQHQINLNGNLKQNPKY